MKSMKGLGMNKVLGSIRRRPTGAAADSTPGPQGDSLEAVAARDVKLFCESGGPNNAGNEVTYLPSIVEAAESSPAAAGECARIIRKMLNRDYWTKPSYQYNAIMLTRILVDNPGPTFTRHLDKKFADAVKELLKSGRDLNVRQILMETLESFEQNKANDQNLALVFEMWTKEKEKAYKVYGGRPPPPSGPRPPVFPNQDQHSQNYFARNHKNRRLPEPVELANRLEEARTSAKLLQQVVANTAPDEVLNNELIREFADRCQSASRSIQGYMTAEDPAPDNETMESLIDTNEQLQQALNQHQRAVLNSRKHLGLNERSQNASPNPSVNGAPPPRPAPAHAPSSGSGPMAPPAVPPRDLVGNNGKGKERNFLEPPTVGSSRSATGTPGPASSTDEAEDPFRDPLPEHGAGGSSSALPDEPRLGFEPYHPGFNPTPSYLGRQDSALNNSHMHGAGPAASEEAREAGNETSGPKVVPVALEEEDLYSDDGEYTTSSKSKQPMYRY